MGLFDFFGGGSSPEKTIDKHRSRLVDKYRQTQERYGAMDELNQMGTAASVTALLARFTIRVDGPTVDEEEKTYCYELLSRMGPVAVEPLKTFIQANNAVYFPLRALREIAGDEVAVDTLLQAMDDCDPGYHEGLDRLREIVSNLRDFQHERVREALTGLLKSRSDEIRFYALDGLASYPGEEVATLFVDRLLDADESQRVKALASELAVDKGLKFKKWAAQLAPVLGPSYHLDSDFQLQRKG
ncbi:MAG: HEAT repeat domain-containing protein [Myxococcales bacterium]|nr:HEAT repeat domain-containing protein [Myxococcales bacterium]